MRGSDMEIQFSGFSRVPISPQCLYVHFCAPFIKVHQAPTTCQCSARFGDANLSNIAQLSVTQEMSEHWDGWKDAQMGWGAGSACLHQGLRSCWMVTVTAAPCPPDLLLAELAPTAQLACASHLAVESFHRCL